LAEGIATIAAVATPVKQKTFIESSISAIEKKWRGQRTNNAIESFGVGKFWAQG